jgi:hypothetical protein
LLPEKTLEDSASYSFIQQIPEGVSSWLACFKAEGCVNGVQVASSLNAGKAMCLLEGKAA